MNPDFGHRPSRVKTVVLKRTSPFTEHEATFSLDRLGVVGFSSTRQEYTFTWMVLLGRLSAWRTTVSGFVFVCFDSVFVGQLERHPGFQNDIRDATPAFHFFVITLVVTSNLVLAFVTGPHTLSSARVPKEAFYMAFFAATFASGLPFITSAFLPRKKELKEDRKAPP